MDSCFFTQQEVFGYSRLPQLEDPDVSSNFFIEISEFQVSSNKVDARDTSIEPRRVLTRFAKTPVGLLGYKKKSKISKKLRNVKKSKSPKDYIGSDYKKNICGYVTKKIMREFVGFSYAHKVTQICVAENADYEATINFYESKIERITGPSHIPPLMTANSCEQIPIIKVFIAFFKWFLEERYVRHLFVQGKMEQKRAYIEYKNRQLLPLIWQIEQKFLRDSQILSPLHGNWESTSTVSP